MVREAERGLNSWGGTRFTLSNVQFRGCWTGVYATGQASPRSILGCRFLPPPGGGLLPPYATFITGHSGVQLVNVQGFTLGSPTGAENRFEQLQHGLFSQNSVVSVYHNRFVGMVATTSVGTPGRGAGIYAFAPLGGNNNYTPEVTVGHPTSTALLTLTLHRNIFQNNVRGVMVERRVRARVRGNTFTANRRGYYERLCGGEVVTLERNTHTNDSLAVHLWFGNGRQGVVDRNTITGSIGAQMHGIRLDNMNNPNLAAGAWGIQVRNNTLNLRGNGIWLQGSDRVNVEGNSVGLRAQVPLEPLRGISLRSNMSGPCRVHNNTVSSATVLGRGDTAVQALRVFGSPESDVTCNTFENVGRGAVFVLSSFPSRYMGNTMRNCVDGFVLMSLGRIGPQGTNIPAVPSENKWLGSFGKSETLSWSSDGTQSRFWVRSITTHWPNQAVMGGNQISLIPWQPPVRQPQSRTGVLQQRRNGRGRWGQWRSYREHCQQQGKVERRLDATQFRADEWAEGTLLKDSLLLQSSNAFQSYHQAMQAIQGKVARANDLISRGDTLGANPQPIIP
ncbi:MAG: right-handed parallel beta-helix repeat-containing protein [Bacteroidia bacterium]